MRYAAVGFWLVSSVLYAQPDVAAWKVQPAGRQVSVDTFPMSTAVSKDGKHLLVLNAGFNPPSVSVLEVASMRETSRTPVPDGWLGLTFSPDGKHVYVGGGSQASVFEFAWADGKLTAARTFVLKDFIGDVKVSPDGRMIYAAGLDDNAVHVINLQSGRVIERFPTGRRPYRILFHPDGKSYFVSSWADGSVYHHDALKGERLGMVRLGQHPTDMVWRSRRADEKAEEYAQWPGRIFVTASNTNTVFAVGVSESKDIQRIESINVAMTPIQPAGSTPSALAMSSDGSRLMVVCSDLNALAVVDISEPKSSLRGFVPVGAYPTAVALLPDGHVAITNGHGRSISVVEPFDDEMLGRYTRTVLGNSPYRDEVTDGPANPTPLQNVIFVVRTTTGKESANGAKLAREFVRYDNFRVKGETSAVGINWSVAAIAPDYVQKLSPSSAAGRRKKSDYEGNDLAALPPAGYLWSNAASAGLAVRVYGFWGSGPAFRTWDANVADADRVKTFIDDLRQFEQSGTMPRLTMLRLGGNGGDAALGALVDAVSKSKFWPNTAIFVAESHAQGSSPSPAFILSPYTRREGVADSGFYDTSSMLRTIELILGLRPMTVFDAAAKPMWSAFSQTPDLRPYDLSR